MADTDDFYRELSDACAEALHYLCPGYADSGSGCQCRCHVEDAP